MEKLESVDHLRETLRAIKGLPLDKQEGMMRELGKRNLFFLVYDILGYKELDPVLHWDYCKQWELKYRHKLLLCPRGTFKTTVFTIGGSIFEIINDPNIRILLSNAVLGNAETILKVIKDHFIYNERFRALYPELCPSNDKKRKITEFGTQTEFSVPNRKLGLRESTMEIGSVDGNLVSRHYDLHIGDDLVNDKNCSTREQNNKVDFFIQAAHSLLEPNHGRDVLIGTRWHYDDVYGRIIEEPFHRGYYIYERSIYEENEKGERVPIFPSRFPLEEIENIRKMQGSSLFAGQYLNNPLPTEDQIFKKEWILYYDTVPQDVKSRLWIVTTVDPAVSTGTKGDKSVVITVGIDHNDDIYVLDYVNKRLDPGQLIGAIFEANEKWSPMVIGIETFAFQKALKYFINMEMKKRRMYLPVKELEQDHSRSKEARIIGFQPRVQFSRFYVRRDMDELVEQMLRFPKTKYDDIIDALANAQQLFRTPMNKKHVPKSHGITFNSLVEKINLKKKNARKIGYGRL